VAVVAGRDRAWSMVAPESPPQTGGASTFQDQSVASRNRCSDLDQVAHLPTDQLSFDPGFWRKVGGKLFRYQSLSARMVSIFHACLFTLSTAELKSSQRDERNSMPHKSSWIVRQHTGHVCEGDQNWRVHTSHDVRQGRISAVTSACASCSVSREKPLKCHLRKNLSSPKVCKIDYML